MLYPLKFEPVYKEYLWGGDHMKEKFGRNIPSDCTAESWDIACHANGMSKVSNGPLAGLPLEALFAYYREPLLGMDSDKYDKFPLLIKIIDAKDRLSLQVHPEDEYADIHENGELGKNEMWYVLQAEEGAELVIGLKDGVTKEAFRQGIEEGNLEELVNKMPVKAGDVIDIPAGLIHAIQEGIMIAEVQQNSDTTYRVFDWNRVGADGKSRPLHVEKALDVIDFDQRISKDKTAGVVEKVDNNTVTHFIHNDYFVIDQLDLLGIYEDTTEGDHMVIYMCLDGSFNVNWNDSVTCIKPGESVLMPASIGSYQLFGQANVLKAYLPTEKTKASSPLVKLEAVCV